METHFEFVNHPGILGHYSLLVRNSHSVSAQTVRFSGLEWRDTSYWLHVAIGLFSLPLLCPSQMFPNNQSVICVFKIQLSVF